MIEFVKEYITRHELLDKNDTVLIGVSGGPDSIALLHILWRLKQEYSLKLHVAHLNHMFRGDEARADAEFVRQLCQRLEVPCTLGEENVPAFVAKNRMSAEEGARYLRYRFFSQLATKIHATKIGLGHHADDQAETILLNLLRGSGLKGLAGMKPKRNMYIRPLLGVTRAEIEEYLEINNLPSRIDSSNLEPIYTRNEIRLKLIPLLKDRYNPNLVNNLNQLSEILRPEDDYLERITNETFKAYVNVQGNQLSISKKTFMELPLALRRRLLRLMFQTLAGREANLTFKTVVRMEKFLEQANYDKNLGLPLEIVLKNKLGIIILSKPQAFNVQEEFNMPLEVPGSVVLPNNSYLTAKVLLSPEEWQYYRKADFNEAYLDWDLIKLPLTVRNRKPGDAFFPLGLNCKKKVKDFFIDQKIPLWERNFIPLVTDSESRIIWVGGCRIDERVKISSATKRVLYLSMQTGKDVM